MFDKSHFFTTPDVKIPFVNNFITVDKSIIAVRHIE